MIAMIAVIAEVFFFSAIPAITAMVATMWGFNLIMAYFKRKGCIQRNLYLNCVSLSEDFEKISYGSVSIACNWRRPWPECVRHVNRTFKLLFYWHHYRAQLFN